MNAAELRAKLKSIVRPKPTPVPVEGIGDLYVRQFTGAELDHLVASRSKDGQIGRVEMVARALCDENGEPLIDVEEPGALDVVGNIPTLQVQAIFEVVRAINGLGGADSPTKAG